jgi:hypothetical protein
MSGFDKILKDLEENKTMSELTRKVYISRIKKLKKLFKSTDELKTPDVVLEALESSTLNTKLSYLNTIIALKKYSSAFDIDLNDYRLKQYDLINEREETLGDDIQNKPVIEYSKLVEVRERYGDIEYGGFEHLIASLYTMIPPLRDDYGNVEFIVKDSDDNDINNYYNLKTHTLILNDYKGSNYIRNKQDKKKKIFFPLALHDIIEESLKLNPRDYLITKKKLKSFDETYSNGNLSSIVKDVFGGFTINDIRHSFASRNMVGKGLNLKELKLDAGGMQHSVGTHMTYFRGIGG